MNHAAVLADGDVAEQFVLALEFFHLRHGVLGIIAAGCRYRVQIRQGRGIDAGLIAARHLAVHAGPRGKTFGEGAGVLIHVPIEGFQQLQALRDFQAHAVHVVHEQQERDHGLPAFFGAEFGRLLYRVDGIAAGVCQADHLGLRALRLQQEGREVRRSQRMLARAQHLAAVLLDVVGGLRLDALAKRVIHRDEIPILAAARHHRRRRGVAGGPGVIDPLDGVRRAGFSGQVGACGG